MTHAPYTYKLVQPQSSVLEAQNTTTAATERVSAHKMDSMWVLIVLFDIKSIMQLTRLVAKCTNIFE